MPSETDLLASIRRWLLVAVALLGLAVVALADIGYSTNYAEGTLYAVIGVSGGFLALVAGFKALASWLPDTSPPDRPDTPE